MGLYKVSSDYTAFEKHFTKHTFLIEMILYEYMLQFVPQGPWLVNLIHNLLTGLNHCHFKKLTALIPSSRMSGEMNTSLGNGFMNLMLFLFLNELNDNTCVDALVEGDDLIGIYSGVKLQERDYARLGFTIKLEYHENVNEASFCGLIYDEEDLVSIPDPHKVLLNIGWTSSRYLGSNTKTRKQLLRAKGLSMLHQYPGAPIIQSMAQYIIRVTEGLRYKFPGEWTNWQKTHFRDDAVSKPVGFRTRMLMEKKFGYSVSEQMHLEAYFDGCDQIQPIVNSIIYSKATRDQKVYNERFVTLPLPSPSNPWVHVVNKSTSWKREQVLKLVDENQGTIDCHNLDPVNTDFCFGGLNN